MKKSFKRIGEGEIVIYQTPKKEVELRVRLEKETVWLDAHQIAALFGVNRPAIVKHINNIYKAGELKRSSTCSKLEQVAADGKVRKMNLYNLDMIISVGYRVNSKRATQFRIWATNTLKQYLVRGYAIDQKRLLEAESKFQELKTTVAFMLRKTDKQQLKGQEGEVLSLLAAYAKTFSLLEQYDQGKLRRPKGDKATFTLQYKDCRWVIGQVKNDLITKKEAGDLFGQEQSGAFQGITCGLYQTFDGKELYKTLEEKAAHLLYFTIKDHPFTDGNKRIGSFLFVYFLDRNDSLYRSTGERKINDNALTALALLIAESDPRDKEILIRIILNLLND